jgi:hypothetical protein
MARLIRTVARQPFFRRAPLHQRAPPPRARHPPPARRACAADRSRRPAGPAVRRSMRSSGTTAGWPRPIAPPSRRGSTTVCGS